MFAQAQSKFKYDLSKIKSILGDNYKLKDYKIEDWYVLEKYFEGEKK
jgi:hypothetical protein